MNFNHQSDVTIVITSCGRLDLLKKTIQSIDKYNKYPIKEVIITEDAGDRNIFDILPSHWLDNTNVIINSPKLGQMASIDKAYSQVKTPYIFHCEDDWEFYRPNFIEDSLDILNNNKDIVIVRLRSFYYDIKPYYPFHYLGDREQVSGIPFYELKSENPDWQGFSLNPGLLRLSDYAEVKPYNRFESSSRGESEISKEFAKQGKRAVLLENDASAHIGFGCHVLTDSERVQQEKKKQKRQIKYIVLFLLGLIIGYLI